MNYSKHIIISLSAVILISCSPQSAPGTRLQPVVIHNSTMDNLKNLLELAFISPPLTISNMREVFQTEFSWRTQFTNEQGIPILSYRATQSFENIINPLGGIRLNTNDFRSDNTTRYSLIVQGPLINRNSCTPALEFLEYISTHSDYLIRREVSMPGSQRYSINRTNSPNRNFVLHAVGNNCVNIVEINNNFP